MTLEDVILKDVGTVIAVRELDLKDGGKVQVTIGMPREFPEGGSFFCPYQIVGLGREKVKYGGGVDAVQAIYLTLSIIATDLYTSAEFKADRLRHLGMKNLGFPVASALADLVPKENE